MKKSKPEGYINPFSKPEIQAKIKETMLRKYGVENISQLAEIKKKKQDTSIKNFGVTSYTKTDEYKNRVKKTNLKKYGKEYYNQTDEGRDRIKRAKAENGGYNKTNASKEATLYFRNYIIEKNYDISQVAYSDPEKDLYEWGYNFENKWYIFDFVVFELGFRGNKNHIIEIIEYQGPFHYRANDVVKEPLAWGTPWKTKNKFQIYNNDSKKEYFGHILTKNYRYVWPEKYHLNVTEKEMTTISAPNDYQLIASSTAIYPDEVKIIYPTLGLASEAGEVAGKIKKVMRDNNRSLF